MKITKITKMSELDKKLNEEGKTVKIEVLHNSIITKINAKNKTELIQLFKFSKNWKKEIKKHNLTYYNKMSVDDILNVEKIECVFETSKQDNNFVLSIENLGTNEDYTTFFNYDFVELKNEALKHLKI